MSYIQITQAKTSFSSDLSKLANEKYYSNAELRTIKKFNSLFNKVVVLPSNTLCGRTGTSFSNGDYEDKSIKEESWKATEEELVHYEENSNLDMNVGKAYHYSSEYHNLQKNRKTIEKKIITPEQHRNIEEDFQCETVIFHKLKNSHYIKKYTSLIRIIREKSIVHSESCKIRMIKTEKKELMLMDKLQKMSRKNLTNVSTEHLEYHCNNCLYVYPISMSNNEVKNTKSSSENSFSKILHKRSNNKRSKEIVEEKYTNIKLHETDNLSNYENQGESRVNPNLKEIKSDVKTKKRQKFKNWSSIDFSKVSFRKIFFKNPQQCQFIVENVAVLESNSSKSNEILKLSYSSHFASAVSNICKTSSKSIAISQEKLTSKSKESRITKKRSILIIKKLFGKKHSAIPLCNCEDVQRETTKKSERSICLTEIPQESMQQSLKKHDKTEKITDEIKRKREDKINNLMKRIIVDERCKKQKCCDISTKYHKPHLTTTPNDSLTAYTKYVLQPKNDDKLDRERRINELIKTMSTKYAYIRNLKIEQQRTQNVATVLDRKITDQPEQRDKQKQREIRLQKLIEEMRKKQKCLCEPCDKPIDVSLSEYIVTDFEMCECKSLTSRETYEYEDKKLETQKDLAEKISSSFIGVELPLKVSEEKPGDKSDDKDLAFQSDEALPEQKIQQKYDIELPSSDQKSEESMSGKEEKSSISRSIEETRSVSKDDISIDKIMHSKESGEINSVAEDVTLSKTSSNRKDENMSNTSTSSSIRKNGEISEEEHTQKVETTLISIGSKVVLEYESVGERRNIPEKNVVNEKETLLNDSLQVMEKLKQPTMMEENDSFNETTEGELITALSDTFNGKEKLPDVKGQLPDDLHEMESKIPSHEEPMSDQFETHEVEKKTDKLFEHPDEEFLMEETEKPTMEREKDNLKGTSDEEFFREEPERTETIEKKIGILPETSDSIMSNDKGKLNQSKEEFNTDQTLQQFSEQQDSIEKKDSELHTDKSSIEIDSSSGSVEESTLRVKVKMGKSPINEYEQGNKEAENMKDALIKIEEKENDPELSKPPTDDSNTRKTKYSDQPELGSNISFLEKNKENEEKNQQMLLTLGDNETTAKSSSSEKIKKSGETMQKTSLPFDDDQNIIQVKSSDLPTIQPVPTTLPLPKRGDEKVRTHEEKESNIDSSGKLKKIVETTDEDEEKLANKFSPKKKLNDENKILTKDTSIDKKAKEKTSENRPIKKKLLSDQEVRIIPHSAEKGKIPKQPKRRSDLKPSKIKELPGTGKKAKSIKTKLDEKPTAKKDNVGNIVPDQSHGPTATGRRVSEIKPSQKSTKTEKTSDKLQNGQDAKGDLRQNKTEVKPRRISGDTTKTKQISKKERKSFDQYLSDEKVEKYNDELKEQVAKNHNDGKPFDKLKGRRRSSEHYSPEKLKRESSIFEDGIRKLKKLKKKITSSQQIDSPDRGDFEDGILNTERDAITKDNKKRQKTSIDYSDNEANITRNITNSRDKSDQEVISNRQIHQNKTDGTKRRKSSIEYQTKDKTTKRVIEKSDEGKARDRRKNEKLLEKDVTDNGFFEHPKSRRRSSSIVTDNGSFEHPKSRRRSSSIVTDYGFFEYPKSRRRSSSISSKNGVEKDTNKSKDVIKIRLNSEYLEILEDVALAKAMEMEEILKISFSPKHHDGSSIRNTSRDRRIGLTTTPSFSSAKVCKRTQKRNESKFIDSELEWSPSSLININILVDDKDRPKCICQKKNPLPPIQNSSTLSNVLSKKSSNIRSKVKDHFVSACKRTYNKVKCNCTRPTNLYFPQKYMANHLRLKQSFSSKKEIQCANTVLFKKLPNSCLHDPVPNIELLFDEPCKSCDQRETNEAKINEVMENSCFSRGQVRLDLCRPNNIRSNACYENIKDYESSNYVNLHEQCGKSRTVEVQENTEMKHRCLPGKELKAEPFHNKNIDSISFVGNIGDFKFTNEVQPFKLHEKGEGVEVERSPKMKKRCTSLVEEVKLEPFDTNNIDSISFCGNIGDFKSTNEATPRKQYEKSGSVEVERSQPVKHKCLSSKEVKLKECNSFNIDSISFCGNIEDLKSSNEARQCKHCEKNGTVEAQRSAKMKHESSARKEVKLKECSSMNIDSISFCGNIKNLKSSNEIRQCEQCEKNGTIETQTCIPMHHRCSSQKEEKLKEYNARIEDSISFYQDSEQFISSNEVGECKLCEKNGTVEKQRNALFFNSSPNNIDTISFCGNIKDFKSFNGPRLSKHCEKRETMESQRSSPIKHRCFLEKQINVEVHKSDNLDSGPLCRNINDFEFSDNVSSCKEFKKGETFEAPRSALLKQRNFRGKEVTFEMDNMNSSTFCNNNKNSDYFNDVKQHKMCEKSGTMGAKMKYVPFSGKEHEIEYCKSDNGDSIAECEKISLLKCCNDVRTYKPFEGRKMIASHEAITNHKEEIGNFNNNTSSVCRNAKNFESYNEMKPMSYDEKTCKCKNINKNIPNVNQEKTITKCKINQNNPQSPEKCDSSAEYLPLKSCPRITLSKVDQKSSADENTTIFKAQHNQFKPIFFSKYDRQELIPLSEKTTERTQMSEVAKDVVDVEEVATNKTDSALLDEKLCRKLGTSDLTKMCTCGLFEPSCLPIYYTNTEQISRLSCSRQDEDKGCVQETDSTKPLAEEIKIKNNSSQNFKTQAQITNDIFFNNSMQMINEVEKRVFTEISDALNRNTTVLNFIEILTQSEQKFMSDENNRLFLNKKKDSENFLLDLDLIDSDEKEKIIELDDEDDAENSTSSSDFEKSFLENKEQESKRTLLVRNKKPNKLTHKQKIKKKKEYLNNYEKQRSITMRKRLKSNYKQTTSSAFSSDKNVNKTNNLPSVHIDSSRSVLDNKKLSTTKRRKSISTKTKRTVNNGHIGEISFKDCKTSVLRKQAPFISNENETLYSPYSINPALYHVAVKSVENLNQTDASNQKLKFRIAFFFKKSKGKIINWFKYIHTMKSNVSSNANNNLKSPDEADLAMTAKINLLKQKKILSSKLRQTDSQTSKLYLYNKFYEDKNPTEIVMSKADKQPKPVLQEIRSQEIIVPTMADDLEEEESGEDQKDEERMAGPSIPSDDSSVLFIKKEVYDRLQRYGKLHYTLYIGDKNEVDHISIESLQVSEEKIKCDDKPKFFASFDLGTKDVLVHVTKDNEKIEKEVEEKVSEPIFKNEQYVACENSQVRLSLMKGAKYLEQLDPTKANIIEIDCSNKLHEIKICYKKIEQSKTCICEYPQVCKNIQLDSSDLSSIVIEKIDKILDAREVCEDCERCKEKSEVCIDYQECSDDMCYVKREDAYYAAEDTQSRTDYQLKKNHMPKHMEEIEHEEDSMKISECCDDICSRKLGKTLNNEDEDDVKTVQFMQVAQKFGFQEDIYSKRVSKGRTCAIYEDHICDKYLSEHHEKQINLPPFLHRSQKPDFIQKSDRKRNMISKTGCEMPFVKDEKQKSLVAQKKKNQKKNSQRCRNHQKPTLILTLTHFKSILEIPC